MTQKEITLLKRYHLSHETSWDKIVADFCSQHLEQARVWARAQRMETIDDLLANTEQIEARGERND